MSSSYAKSDPRLFREGPYWQRAILAHLSWKPMTVLELADSLGLDTAEVMMHLHALRRYGFVEEAPKARRERYYRYQIKE